MNHRCHGDRMMLDGETYYRCLLDSTMVIGAGKDGDECPNCDREISGGDLGELTTRTRREYLHPEFGWLPYYPLPEPK